MEVANSSTDPQMEVDTTGKHFQVATVREGQNVTFPGPRMWRSDNGVIVGVNVVPRLDART